MQCQGLVRVDSWLNRFWTWDQKPTGLQRFSLLRFFPKQLVPREKTQADQNETPSRQRGQHEYEENLGKQKIVLRHLGMRWWVLMTGWTLGDTLGRETCCMVAPPSVTYLKVIFFVWLSGIPFITGHLSTKEKGKNYPWILVKVVQWVST